MEEKILEKVIETLATSIREDVIPKDFEKIVEDLKDSYMTKNPKNASVCLFFKIDTFKEYLAKAIMPEYETVDRKNLWKLILLWQDYNVVENYISSFVSTYEGHCCSADKGCWLLDRYMNNLIDGSVPEMKKEKGQFQKPSFGTFEEWYNFIDSYISSRYKYNPDFLIASAKLIQVAEDWRKK